MDTKYRVTDLRDLQTKIIQAFLKMEIDTEYPDGAWRDSFYEEVKREKDGRNAVSYKGTWEKILEKGIDHLSIDDLDTTAMTAILNYMRCFNKCEFFKMKKVTTGIQSDRNFEAHMNSNETIEELYDWISATIFNLKNFVFAAEKNSHAEDSIKEGFAKEYLHKIKDIDTLAKADLESYYAHKGVLKQVQRIKNSKRMLDDYYAAFWPIMRAVGPTGDWTELAEFVIAAAEAGIEFAYSEAAEMYFSGRGVEKDFLKSEYYCRKALDSELRKSDVRTAVILASIYINGLCESEPREYGWAILDHYKDSFTFEEKETDGIITFEPISKR